MESKEVTIARLVLGYLKTEKCRTAYKEFFRNSRHLQSFHLTSISKSKYIPTRLVGLTLEDILTEYYDICLIIQGRLEATNYYNENHPKMSLVDQLIYLLNTINHSSRVSTPRSTPCPRSPGDSQLNESNHSGIDQISDIETTSVHNLPGNKHFSDEAYHKTSRRSNNEQTTVENDQNPDIVVNSEVLAQTLLENKEFHEKIAQTINKVAEKQSKESAELNETIRTVVKETEEDPIFDKILDEIIGSAGIVDKPIETNSINNQKFAEENDKSKKPDSVVQCDSSSQTQKRNDIIVFDGSLDKYLVSNVYSVNTQTVPPPNPLYINTSSNVVVLPTVANMTATIPSQQQYYLINKPPTVSCIVPPAVLTEQDILTMPTVIVNDDRPVIKPPTPPTNGLKKNKSGAVVKPKGYAEVAANVDIREFLKNYGAEETPKTGLKKVIYPKNSTAGKETKTDNAKVNNIQSQMPEVAKVTPVANFIIDAQPIDPTKENVIANNTNKNTNTEENIKNLNMLDLAKSTDSQEKNDKVIEVENISVSNKELNTPVPIETLKKTTPKSGSHVRNLDFSTPPKITPDNKISKDNKNEKKNPVEKKQAVKSLFKQDETTAVKKSTWDADLRAIVIPDDNPKKGYSKRKKKGSPIKSKKRAKIQKKEKVDLNTTEQEGALLEAALKTPIKLEIKAETSNNEDQNALQISEKDKLEDSDSKCQDSNKDDNNGEHVEAVKSKTILSPSKLNANKRTLVNSTENESNEKNKFITPEMSNEKHSLPASKANRNILPLLETPLKDNNIPKTPCILTPMDISTSPLNNTTPFTKMLEANLKGLDIAMLPTPSIPITPNFPPFTPNVDLVSPYSNRPTDYSTSSSYYQPSDSEQNKYLENQLLEIEKTSVKVVTETSTNTVKSQGKLITTAEHLNIFNKNVIGKKNLNLVKRSKDSSSSESNSESSNDDTDENDESFNQETNDTVIFKKKASETPKRVYSLRARSITNYRTSGKNMADIKEKTVKPNTKQKNKKAKKQKLNEETESDTSKISPPNKSKEICLSDKSGTEELNTEQSVESKSPEQTSVGVEEFHKKDKLPAEKTESSVKAFGKLASSQQNVLEELAEKRQRTINKIKTAIKDPPPKRNGKFKIKPIPEVCGRKRPRKSGTPKKNCQVIETKISARDMKILQQDLINSDDSDDNLSLKLSLSDTEIPDSNHKLNINSDKSASDVEAQNLIEGLKERGILLMQNKSQKGKDSRNDMDDESTMLEEPNDNKSLGNASNKNISDLKMNSSVEMCYSVKETLDFQSFEGENIHIKFDENIKCSRTLESVDIQKLLKPCVGKLYIEEINQDIDIPIRCTEFWTIFELESKLETPAINSPSHESSEQVNITQETSLDNFKQASTSEDITIKETHSTIESEQEDTSVNPQLKSTKGDQKEIKCEKLLKNLNVDSFLNRVYDT